MNYSLIELIIELVYYTTNNVIIFVQLGNKRTTWHKREISIHFKIDLEVMMSLTTGFATCLIGRNRHLIEMIIGFFCLLSTLIR